MSFQNIPAELKAINNWVVWNTETRDGKQTKPLYDAKQNGKRANAKVNDATTWASFNCAVEASDILFGSYEGAGFVFTDTDFVGVDLDGVVHEDKTIDPFAVEIIKIANTYCEFSPSGTGIHLIFESSLPLPAGNRKGSKKLGGEIYNGTSPRYFTVTGDKADLSVDDITKIDDPEKIALLHFMVLHLHDTKLTRLWMGDTSAYDNDDSGADFALMCELAKFTRKDPVKMEQFFSASVLGRRDKWIDRADYRQRTVKAALDNQQRAKSINIQSSSRELEFHLPAVEEGTHRDYVIAPAAGQKDGWFPLGAVSLVGGPSGGSKTTWMLQLLIAQMLKVPFHGHVTYGRPYLMLGADRGEDAHKRTMERMNLSLASVPFQPLPLAWDLTAAQAIVDQIEATVPLPEIVFVEGCDMLVTEVNSIKAVAYFVHALQKIAHHYRIAIVGSLGSPKAKEGHGYTATRDNLLGSGGWGRTAETVALLQFPKNDDTSGRRQLTVVLRNAPAEKFTLAFVDGLLEVQPDDHSKNEGESEQESRDIDWYKTQARLAKTDSTKKWWTVLDMERALHLAHTTADRHIRHDYAKKHLVKKTRANGQGVRGQATEYRWNESQKNLLWVEQQEQEKANRAEAFSKWTWADK